MVKHTIALVIIALLSCVNEPTSLLQENNSNIVGTWIFTGVSYGPTITNGDTVWFYQKNDSIIDTFKLEKIFTKKTFNFFVDSFAYSDTSALWFDTLGSPVFEDKQDNFGKWSLKDSLLITIWNDTFYTFNPLNMKDTTPHLTDTLYFIYHKMSDTLMCLTRNVGNELQKEYYSKLPGK